MRKAYAYDPHLDPQLQWAGKTEHTSFEVPTVSLHVHERIDPRSIIEAVKKRQDESDTQTDFFGQLEQNPPLREAVEFYKHAHGWSNRLVAGDSTLVMNSMLEKEGLAGKVQMFYFDPPYGIKYGSNFQPFVNKRDVRDGKDDDLTSEPEQIRAFRDTWELGIHSYLTYLRDRLLLARELLTESGSVFVQISDENVHHVREIMDEVFGARNFCGVINYVTTSTQTLNLLPSVSDVILWYARDKKTVKYRQLYFVKEFGEEGASGYDWVASPDAKEHRKLSKGERADPSLIPNEWRLFSASDMTSSHESKSSPFTFQQQSYSPGHRYWSTHAEGLQRLAIANRLIGISNSLRYKRFFDDFPVYPLSNFWRDTGVAGFTSDRKIYVVQTNQKVIQRCLLMTTDPGDLVFDPTCGSGTTAYLAEQWGRRWITCDTSRVALTLAKQRLMTALFDYYELAHPQEGVGSGFKYRTVPHVTLKSIANNPDIVVGSGQGRVDSEGKAGNPKRSTDHKPLSTKMTRKQIDAAIARHADQETLYDQPFTDSKRKRVSGPFTVEAVPAPAVKSVDSVLGIVNREDPLSTGHDPLSTKHFAATAARSGETLRQNEWRDELQRTGIRGKAGQHIRFARLEPLPGCRWLHADGESRPSDEGGKSVREKGTAYVPQRIVVSFGPEHAPLEQKQVELAWEEARTLVPKPKLIIFAAFQFDPEAAKDVDEMKSELAGMQFLKVQMNADMLTDDLKKNRSSNESFWLIGQPDVALRLIKRGEHKGKWEVEVYGFDYYNTKTGGIESGGVQQIAVWMLDTDYDGRSLYPRQVFFPMAGDKEGWARLAKNLKAEIDEKLIEAYRGTVSLPFELEDHSRVAVKIVDDRGVESLKVMEVK